MFKIGDKVEITRKSTEQDEMKGWDASWVDMMDRTVGQVGEVVYDAWGDGSYTVRVPHIYDNGAVSTRTIEWNYPPGALRKVGTLPKWAREILGRQEVLLTCYQGGYNDRFSFH